MGGKMKRVMCLFLVFMLAFTTCAYATGYDTLKTNFAQGGNPTAVKAIIGSGQLYTGPCRILSVSFYSSTAGDTIGVYDTVDPGFPITDLEFEMGIAGNTSNPPAYHPNAPFLNGIRILSTSATAVTTVTFDY
jgi:hypothetical protein